MDRVRYNANELPPLTADQQADLKRLAMRSDEAIDLFDIPEVTDWSGANRGNVVLQNPFHDA